MRREIALVRINSGFFLLKPTIEAEFMHEANANLNHCKSVLNADFIGMCDAKQC